ncbi:hypothetical protein ACLOJK_005339 [Asimina triloba]
MLSQPHPLTLVAVPTSESPTPWSRGIPNSSVPHYHRNLRPRPPRCSPAATAASSSSTPEAKQEERPKLIWMKIGPDITDSQKHLISRLPPKMTKRCKAVAERIIYLSGRDGADLSHLLCMWAKIMKPRRADWLSVMRELKKLEVPTLLQVMECAVEEESFEANVRDYTKMIDAYAKQNCLQDAENVLAAMKIRGFMCDQITLTVLVHMYSKAGNLLRAEETFKEMRSLGLMLDKRAYGSMIMAYIRAGMANCGEKLLREMEDDDISAGREVYKALLRAYSIAGDASGAQRVFDAIQFAGICPDAKLCALLMNAYRMAGQSDKARIVLENLRRAGLEPSDKCVALMLGAYEEEGNLSKALALLVDLEKDGFVIGEEASHVLAKWFGRLGIVDEVEHTSDFTRQISIVSEAVSAVCDLFAKTPLLPRYSVASPFVSPPHFLSPRLISSSPLPETIGSSRAHILPSQPVFSAAEVPIVWVRSLARQISLSLSLSLALYLSPALSFSRFLSLDLALPTVRSPQIGDSIISNPTIFAYYQTRAEHRDCSWPPLHSQRAVELGSKSRQQAVLPNIASKQWNWVPSLASKLCFLTYRLEVISSKIQRHSEGLWK